MVKSLESRDRIDDEIDAEPHELKNSLHPTPDPVTRWLSTGYMGVGYLHHPTPMHITDPQGLTWCWCRV